MHICIRLWVWEYSLKIYSKHELLFDIVLIYVLVFSSEIYTFYAVIYNFKYPSRFAMSLIKIGLNTLLIHTDSSGVLGDGKTY